MKYAKAKIFILTLALLAAANVAASAKADGLASQRWQLVEINGRRAATSKAFIQINEDQGRFMGNTGRNQMFGSVAVIGKRIEFSKIGTTRMACMDREVNRQETALVRALENAKRYRQAGSLLELLDGNRVIARFSALRDSDNGGNGLGSKKWVLESIAGMKTFKALPNAFLNFDAKKGSVGGDTSCNVFGGEFAVKGSQLSITDVISTMRACIEDERMSVERAFLDGLRDTNRYEIRNGRLMLYNNKKLLLTFRAAKK